MTLNPTLNPEGKKKIAIKVSLSRNCRIFFFFWPLSKKIRDTKGTFHAKMGLIKDRNGMDLTDVEDIKKRWQEYTELYKKRSSRPR